MVTQPILMAATGARTPELVSIQSDALSATVSSLGAELVGLQAADELELLWDGDPAFWTGRSPLLFPIVGSVKEDRITVLGRYYPMARHGFARTSRFELVEHERSRCRWRLLPNNETRSRYPFAFRLDMEYAIAGTRLTMCATIANEGDEPLPASFGFHPAFRWPIDPQVAREQHEIRFEKPEPASIRRLQNGLLGAAAPSPAQGNRLPLGDHLFADDALIFDRLESRALSYGGPNGRQLELEFRQFPHLGVWSKPGAGFICLEPWQGFASPVGFDGELREKPGIVEIAAGSMRTFELHVHVR